MNNIEQLQKQLKELQSQIDNLRKQIEAAPTKKKLFESLGKSSTLDMVSEAVSDFTDGVVDFSIRGYGTYKDQGFYLGNTLDSCLWEIIEDDDCAWVLKLKDTE